MKRIIRAGILLVLLLCLCGCGKSEKTLFQEKEALLREQMLTETLVQELGLNPAGDVGYAVFFSVSDGQKRAEVYAGIGSDVDAAWSAAAEKTVEGLKKSKTQPLWVKADSVFISDTYTISQLEEAVREARSGFLRFGVAFDNRFHTALLETELNCCGAYDYEEGTLSLEKLNGYLKANGKAQLTAWPEQVTVFQTFGRFCDENNQIHKITSSGYSCGRREVDVLDASCAETVLRDAGEYLAAQLQEDGSYIYGHWGRTGKEIDGYNILRHAGTTWALIQQYRMAPNPELRKAIDNAVAYLCGCVVYKDENTAYLYEESSDEIKLGGCGLGIIALTEYIDVFGSEEYQSLCVQLGNGILALLDQTDGTYYHVLNRDFSPKEQTRTVYYDGEATFALCRLYGLTGDALWLDAAKSAVDHFLAADYVQHRDQWVAYSMNEITKYVQDPAYFAFALRNVQENYERIQLPTTAPVCLELLMTTFELYDRLLQSNGSISGFDHAAFLQTIYDRANRLLDGFVTPEVAMYMHSPQEMLHGFMVREDRFRARIDDTQHAMGGLYLYWQHYDRLVELGMPVGSD